MSYDIIWYYGSFPSFGGFNFNNIMFLHEPPPLKSHSDPMKHFLTPRNHILYIAYVFLANHHPPKFPNDTLSKTEIEVLSLSTSELFEGAGQGLLLDTTIVIATISYDTPPLTIVIHPTTTGNSWLILILKFHWNPKLRSKLALCISTSLRPGGCGQLGRPVAACVALAPSLRAERAPRPRPARHPSDAAAAVPRRDRGTDRGTEGLGWNMVGKHMGLWCFRNLSINMWLKNLSSTWVQL